MSKHLLLLLGLMLLGSAVGCTRIEGGFRYEFDGRVFQPDGKTPIKGVSIRMARVDTPDMPDLTGTKAEKAAAKYVEKAARAKSNSEGRYLGALETLTGWHYEMVMGTPVGQTQAPHPPVLPEVILYIQQPGSSSWTAYRVNVPADNQTEAYSRVRKIHLPDVVIPARGEAIQVLTRPTTAPTTTSATIPATSPATTRTTSPATQANPSRVSAP